MEDLISFFALDQMANKAGTFMHVIKDRFSHLSGSTKGRILVAISMRAISTAVWGM